MKKITIMIMSMLIITVSLSLRAGQREDQMYNSILKATFISDKSPIAEELARLGTDDAKAKLIRLIEDQSSWNRSAAVKGLFSLPDSSAGPVLFDRMLSDHMIDDEIAGGFTSRISAYYGFLTGKYRTMTDPKSRERIIEIISSSKTPRGDAFLKGIIEDGESRDRECAFRNLTIHYKSNNYSYIKSRRDTVIFKVHALTYLAENGTPEDLAIFREILDKKEDVKYRLIAYKAVNRWGDDALRHRVFLAALRESDETLAQGGIYVFSGIRSDEIKGELCRIAKKGAYQMTRIAAATRLQEYTAPDIIPALVIILRENYIQRERGGVDIFASIITFGITSVFDDISRKQQRSSFESNQHEIAEHLKKITGADNGSSFERWSEWAIWNGYTISGDNIIQHLFSGYRLRREKAMEQAMRLLGYSSGRDFFSKNGNFASDTELSLTLAKMLITKGFLQDER